MIQSGGLLGRLLGPLLKTGLPVMKDVIKPLATSALGPLGLTAAATAGDSGIRQKILACGITTLITPNDEMEGIMKIVEYFGDSGLL